ncbi:MAG: class I SAM-dependent methyltransferase [Saprospiraceae bacterium]|nr:class I SAM-dependent methyltransferase [Pyrinomonadaceae bacterium]
MTNNVEIKKWESVEVERSASEAQKKLTDDLRISDRIIERYSKPPADTPYPLEFAYYLLGDAAGKTVLDYGCGSGDNSVLLADHGAKVIGVDISPELTDLANKRLDLHGFGERVEFRVGSAHDLPLDNESVDVVFGMAILHHLDLDLASREVFRVLKKGGRAIFFEPVRNSALIRFIRKMIPYQSPDVSPFERPLTDKELKDFAAEFTNYRSRAFQIPFVNLVEMLGLPDKVFKSATRLDGLMLKNVKFLNYYASIRVIEMEK